MDEHDSPSSGDAELGPPAPGSLGHAPGGAPGFDEDDAETEDATETAASWVPGGSHVDLNPTGSSPGVGAGADVVAGASLMPLSMPPFSPLDGETTTVATTPGGSALPGGPLAGPALTSGDLPPGATFGSEEVGSRSREVTTGSQRSRHRLFAAAAAAALVAGGVGAGLGVALSGSTSTASGPTHVPVISSPSGSTQTSTGATESTSAISKAVEPAVVDINTNVASMASQGQEQAAGTGMIVTSSGEVLTNNHVVEQATSITVTIQGHAGTYPATVIAVDPSKDVALLQIEGYSGSLPTVSLGNSSTASLGSSVVAIGNALGLGAQPTTVTGIVSALHRTINATDPSSPTLSETLHGLIETDAPIQPGDSGGPLLNAHGQVIGMDTAAYSSADSGATLGFAIPINEARTIVQHMERGQTTDGVVLGVSPFLGIFEGSASTGSVLGGLGGTPASSVSGVPVYDVAIGGPAQAAGIVAGDTITKVDSTPTATASALHSAIASYKVGDQVTITYVDTTGTTHTATVTLAGIPA